MSPNVALQYSARAQRRAAYRATDSLGLIRSALQQIAVSRTRVSRRRISGGAEDPLHEKIRMALIVKTLPCIEGQAWAGSAPGTHACACCGLPIRVREIEYEPRDHTELYAHYPCFIAWRAESALLGRVRDGERGATAAGA